MKCCLRNLHLIDFHVTVFRDIKSLIDFLCSIEWCQAATTSPDPFDLDASLTTGVALGSTATASDVYLVIPGSASTTYGGLVLTEDSTTTNANKDIVGGCVRATGQNLHLTVNSYNSQSGVDGFHLVWNQVPCSNVFQQ